MSEPLWQPRSDRAARLLGFAFFAGGLALVGYQGKVILDAVAAHADRVSYFLSAIGLGAMAVVFGAYWLIRGLAGYAAIRALQKNPRRMRIFSVLVAVGIISVMIAVKLYLAALGYRD